MNADLDKQIAEKVMGWISLPPSPYWYTADGKPWLGENLGYLSFQQWQPSSSIEDAWHVVEKLRTDDDLATQFWIEPREDGYMVKIDTEEAWQTIVADTAPMAICLAALRHIELLEKADMR